MDFLKKEKWNTEDNGMHVSKEVVVSTAFSDDQQDGLWNIEDDSWWFQYRADVITGLMDRFFKKNKLTVDVGGGNGYTSFIAMEKGYRTGLIEPSIEACRHAMQRGIKEVCCGTMKEDTIEDDSLDQVLLLDVLEHIEKDREFLSLLYRKVAVGGVLHYYSTGLYVFVEQ